MYLQETKFSLADMIFEVLAINNLPKAKSYFISYVKCHILLGHKYIFCGNI